MGDKELPLLEQVQLETEMNTYLVGSCNCDQLGALSCEIKCNCEPAHRNTLF